MSAAPRWLDEVVQEFGRGAGLRELTLGERGVAGLKGDNGTELWLEYVDSSLVVRMTVEVEKTVETAKKVLLLADPMRQGRHRVRTGFLMRSEKAFFAVKVPQEEATLPVLNDVYEEVRRLADRFVGGNA